MNTGPFTSSWPTTVVGDPRDSLTQDQLLIQHQLIKEQLAVLKEQELDLRKYIVKRAFPEAQEGTNTKDLGNGYQLKSAVKFNYKLDSNNEKIWDCLDRIKKIGNNGSFIAERLISWHPSFLLTEYRVLQEEAKDGSEDAKAILREVTSILTIDEAAPTLEIKAPKGKK